MNSSHPFDDHVFVPLRITVKAETFRLLTEMANDMGISLDDVLSFLAEDAVIDLEKPNYLDGVCIPDKCSKEDLLKAIE